MADKKKKAAPKKSARKVDSTKLQIKKAPKHDGILYARVKKDNADFLHGKAKAAEVSLSVYMDQLTDKLRAGDAVKV